MFNSPSSSKIITCLHTKKYSQQRSEPRNAAVLLKNNHTHIAPAGTTASRLFGCISQRRHDGRRSLLSAAWFSDLGSRAAAPDGRDTATIPIVVVTS